ncbi:MAG: hypothetical protein ACLP9L_05435 [Thermoguttaceae bacterium]
MLMALLLLTLGLGGAALHRYLQILEYPTGYGRTAKSPDGSSEASALTMTDKYFFGGERHYYEFVVIWGHGTSVSRRVVVDVPIGETMEWRDDGAINWSRDGTAVNFAWDSVKLAITP